MSRYAAACVYNALSAFSAREAAFYLDLREEDAAALLGQMEEVFQVHRTRRSGYGKVINIADRLCRGFGGGAFSFAIRRLCRRPSRRAARFCPGCGRRCGARTGACAAAST